MQRRPRHSWCNPHRAYLPGGARIRSPLLWALWKTAADGLRMQTALSASRVMHQGCPAEAGGHRVMHQGCPAEAGGHRVMHQGCPAEAGGHRVMHQGCPAEAGGHRSITVCLHNPPVAATQTARRWWRRRRARGARSVRGPRSIAPLNPRLQALSPRCPDPPARRAQTARRWW